MQNKIFTTVNEPLQVGMYSLTDPAGDPIYYSTLSGLPIGTSDNSATGELALKVIIVGQRSGDATGENGINDSGPARNVVAVTPDDSNDLPNPSRGILVNDAGDMKVTDVEGNDTTIEDIVAGSILPIQVARVWATGTTSTKIYNLF